MRCSDNRTCSLCGEVDEALFSRTRQSWEFTLLLDFSEDNKVVATEAALEEEVVAEGGSSRKWRANQARSHTDLPIQENGTLIAKAPSRRLL